MWTKLARSSLLLIVSVSAVLGSGDLARAAALDCSPGWAAADSIVVTPYDVPVLRQIDMGVIEGFTMNELRDPEGKPLRPKNLADAVCMLHMILDDQTAEAIRSGLIDFTETKSARSSGNEYLALESSIDRRLYALYGDALGEDSGMLTMLVEIGFHMPAARIGGATELMDDAINYGIYVSNDLAQWVWFHYLISLGVDGFDGQQFVDRLKLRLLSYAPPTTLVVDECPEPLAYEWATFTRSPIGVRINPRPYAHWGICRSTDTLFYYHNEDWAINLRPEDLRFYPRIDPGWHPAGSDEEEYFCTGYQSREELAAYCERHE